MPFYVFACECGESEQQFSHKPDGGTPPIHCGRKMERDWHGEARRHIPASGFPYVTKHLNGEPIEVRSIEHERELCKRFNKVKRDDVAWIDERYEGYEVGKIKDYRTGERYPGRQKYTNGSGRGNKGQWV